MKLIKKVNFWENYKHLFYITIIICTLVILVSYSGLLIMRYLVRLIS